MFVSVLLTENSELSKLIIQSCKTDLGSSNEYVICLALHCIANVGGKEMATSVSTNVQRLLVDGFVQRSNRALKSFSDVPAAVQKKAALCLLRFARKSPELLPTGEFPARVISLLASPDMVHRARAISPVGRGHVGELLVADPREPQPGGVQGSGVCRHQPPSSSMSSLPSLLPPSPTMPRDGLPQVLLAAGEESYVYYGSRAPWAVVKILRLLQAFPFPSSHLPSPAPPFFSPYSFMSLNFIFRILFLHRFFECD